MKKIDQYSQKYIHFYTRFIPELLLKIVKSQKKGFTVLDLGCGDGATLWALQKKGFLKNAQKIVGVDISQERCQNLEKNIKGAMAICADASKVAKLKDETFDVIICSQLIEHIRDEVALLDEVQRLLKGKGYFYLSTIMKKWYGIWLHRYQGRFLIDPSHRREYSSIEEVVSLFKNKKLKIIKKKIKPVKFGFIDLLFRFFIKTGVIKNIEKIRLIFEKQPFLAKINHYLTIPAPGYFIVEIGAKKEK